MLVTPEGTRYGKAGFVIPLVLSTECSSANGEGLVLPRPSFSVGYLAPVQAFTGMLG